MRERGREMKREGEGEGERGEGEGGGGERELSATIRREYSYTCSLLGPHEDVSGYERTTFWETSSESPTRQRLNTEHGLCIKDETYLCYIKTKRIYVI